jgi:tartrate-resistant acid phosphatase type 5
MHFLNFLVIGDWGYNSSDQTSVANAMKTVASANKTDFIVSVGDNFYFNGGGYNYDGVLSRNDDKFTDLWEKKYDGALSQLPWYLVLGNHDWYSCPECQIQYSKVNSRWKLPAFFHTKTILNSDFKAAFIFLDVNLLANGINGDSPAMKENLKKISKNSVYFIKRWIIKQLEKFSNFDYIFVVGHYPIGIILLLKLRQLS